MSVTGPGSPTTPNPANTPDSQAKAQGTPSSQDQARFADALGKKPADPQDKPRPADDASSTLRTSGNKAPADPAAGLFSRSGAQHGLGDSPSSGRERGESRADHPSDLFRGRMSARTDAPPGEPKPADGDAPQNRDTPVDRKAPDNADLPQRGARQPRQERDEPIEEPVDPAASRSLAMEGTARPAELQPAAAEQVAAPRAEAALSVVVREIADRITVGQTGPTGQDEVRITLKSDVLGGTEIRITENAGAVEVTFVAGNKDMEQFLGARQDDISSALGDRLGRDVEIRVVDSNHDTQASQDRNGSDSSGSQRQQEQNDGRSRNRRFVEDEVEK